MPRLTFRRADEIRWYLYRSASKLDLLFDQMVSSSGPFAGSVSVGVPGLEAKVGTSPISELTDEEKLDVVEKELRARDLVGSYHEPREYFAGELPMRWGLFDDQGGRPAGDPPLVFFGGIDREANVIVGLGGSSRHVVGHFGASSTYSRSNTRAVVDWLLAGLEEQPVELRWDFDTERQLVLAGVGIALHYLRPPTQKLRFLAKTLLAGRMPGHEHMTGMDSPQTLIGTPLYVTMVDPPHDEDRWGLDDQW